jgi:hypothetical protein
MIGVYTENNKKAINIKALQSEMYNYHWALNGNRRSDNWIVKWCRNWHMTMNDKCVRNWKELVKAYIFMTQWR